MVTRYPILEDMSGPDEAYNNATRRLWPQGFAPESLFKDVDGNTLTLWINAKSDDSRISVKVKGRVIIYKPMGNEEVAGGQGSVVSEEEAEELKRKAELNRRLIIVN